MKLTTNIITGLLIASCFACSSSNRSRAVVSTSTGPAGSQPTPAVVTTVSQAPDSIKPMLQLLADQLNRAGIKEAYISADSRDAFRPNRFYLGFRNTVPEDLRSVAGPLAGMNPEGYLIRADGKSAILLGNSVAALRHAVYDYLQQLGFRYFQPGPEWQVVPAINNPFISYENRTEPAFHTRILANGHGYLKNEALNRKFNEWSNAAGLGGFFELNIGHIYQVIVANNRQTFLSHPEYFAGNVKKGEIPPAPKFNVANADLVNLVKKDALFRIRESARIGKPLMMVSMEPSDGGGHCNTPACLKIGDASDQVFYLVNEVAKEVTREYPGMWVGSLAYNQHIRPTKLPLEKNVFVMVTNGFNRTEFSTLELLEQWGKKAGKLGIYDYLSVYEWDNDMPGVSGASRIKYIQQSVRDFYSKGARAYMAETYVGYMSKGLGQYIVSRLLWNPAVNVDSLADDYFARCFGKVAPIVRKLYSSWENAPKGLLSDNLLADWIDWVQEADRANADPQIAKRLDHIKMYLHYLVLYKKLKSTSARNVMYDLLVFANRTMDIAAFATVPVMASLTKTSGFTELGYYANPNQPWRKSTQPVSTAELNNLIIADRKSLVKVEGMRHFSALASFAPLPPASNPFAARTRKAQATFIGTTRFVVRITRQSPGNQVTLTGGLSAKTNPGKPMILKVFDYNLFQQIKDEADVLLLDEHMEMKKQYTVSLASLKPGDYVIEVEDLQRAFQVSMSGELLYNVIISNDLITQTSSVAGLNNFIVQVPEGVTHIVVNKSKSLRIETPTGRKFDFADNKTSSHVIEVKKGEAGSWLFHYQAGILNIEGVPPFLGIDPQRFLAPSN